MLARTRALERLVDGISTTDPITFIPPPLLLGVAALIAGLLPAMRATRMDPLDALRLDYSRGMFVSVTPNLIVRDVAASLAFYRDVLGFTAGDTVPDAPPYVFVMLARDGVPVFLNDVKAAAHDLPGFASTPPGGTCAMFFIVTEVDALHAAVAPHATVVMALKNQFYGMREFSITDPDGHVITFAERVSGN